VTALNIDPSQIRAVLIDDQSGWIPTRNARVVSVAGPVKWGPVLEIDDRDNGFLYVPMSSVKAIRTKQPVRTREELDAEIAARAKEQERLLLWQTYAPSRAAYEEAVEAQGGMCANCGVALDASPIKHYVNGAVLCRACSPLKPRFGMAA
jgi:hypothetical protein